MTTSLTTLQRVTYTMADRWSQSRNGLEAGMQGLSNRRRDQWTVSEFSTRSKRQTPEARREYAAKRTTRASWGYHRQFKKRSAWRGISLLLRSQRNCGIRRAGRNQPRSPIVLSNAPFVS